MGFGSSPQSLIYNQVLVMPGMLIVMILAPVFARACALPNWSLHVLGVLEADVVERDPARVDEREEAEDAEEQEEGRDVGVRQQLHVELRQPRLPRAARRRGGLDDVFA